MPAAVYWLAVSQALNDERLARVGRIASVTHMSVGCVDKSKASVSSTHPTSHSHANALLLQAALLPQSPGIMGQGVGKNVRRRFGESP